MKLKNPLAISLTTRLRQVLCRSGFSRDCTLAITKPVAAEAAPTMASRSNGLSSMKRQRAFTMVEMAIVIIIIGILTASLAPLVLRQHTNTMEGRDRTALEEAKTAIINYAISFGGIPDPVTINGITNAMSAVPAFGVNNWGAFGDGTTNPFRLDVNDSLKSNFVSGVATGTPGTTGLGGDPVVFCQTVNAQLTTTVIPPPYPWVCQDYTGDHVTTACPAASAVPAAFVLYSTGNDRTANQENNETGLVAGNPGYRIYENDKRGINNSPDTGTLHGHYDDQVMSYPMPALARDCREKMHVLPEVMTCPAGQKFVGSITNNFTAQVAYDFNVVLPALPTLPVPVNYTVYVNQCRPKTDTLTVQGGTNLAATPLSLLDTNKDGRVDVFIEALTGDVKSQ